MAKALLKYTFLFEPGSNTWTNLFQFEGDLAKFFAQKGLRAQVLKTIDGGSPGERICELIPEPTIETKPQPENTQVRDNIKQIQQKTPPKDFKRFQNPRHPDNRPPKPTYNQGRTLRQKVRMP